MQHAAEVNVGWGHLAAEVIGFCWEPNDKLHQCCEGGVQAGRRQRAFVRDDAKQRSRQGGVGPGSLTPIVVRGALQSSDVGMRGKESKQV